MMLGIHAHKIPSQTSVSRCFAAGMTHVGVGAVFQIDRADTCKHESQGLAVK